MPELIRRDFQIATKLLASNDRQIGGVISSGALDAYGEILDPAGIRWRDGVKLLWAHDPKSPIGKAERIAVEGDKVTASFRFADPGIDATADRVHSLARAGLVDRFSVGGIAHRWQGNRCTDFEIIECSLVSVPANSEAVVTSVRTAPERTDDDPRAHLRSISTEELEMDRSGLARDTSTERPAEPTGVRVIRSPAVHSRDSAVLQYSFGRALALATGEYQQAGIDVGLELEVHQEMIRRGFVPKRGGTMLSWPGMLRELRRDIASTPGSAAAALTSVSFRPDLFGIDAVAARASLIAGRLGCQIITSDEPLVHIPRQDEALPPAEWIARDSPGTFPQGDFHIRNIALTPKCVHGAHRIMRSARLYSTPSVYMLYAQQLTEKMNYAVDAALFYGNTALDPDSPEGLRRMGIQTYNFGAAGAPGAFSYLGSSDMKSLVDILPVDPDRRGWLMSPLLESTGMTTWRVLSDPTAGVAGFVTTSIIPEGGGSLLGQRITTATQIPIRANRSTDLWYGDWAQCGLCYFGPGLEVLTDPYTSPGNINLHAWQDVDTFCMDPKRFVIAEDPMINQTAASTVPVPAAALPANGSAKAKPAAKA